MIKNIASYIFLILMLNACSIGSTQVPEDHYYRLPPPEAGAGRAAVQVDAVRVSGMLHERAILYVEADNPLEVKRFHYHHWADTPENMVRRYLQGWFGEAGDKAIPLDILIRRFELLKQAGNNRVVVDLRVKTPDHEYQYHQETPVQGSDMTDVVRAFGSALDQVMQQLNQALKQA